MTQNIYELKKKKLWICENQSTQCDRKKMCHASTTIKHTVNSYEGGKE